MSRAMTRAFYNSQKLETRESESGSKTIEGYFIVYDSETELYPGSFERIARGAATKALGNNDIRALFNHDTGNVLGRTSSKTLELREDEHGVFGIIHVNEADSMAVDVYNRVARGDISGCSFGFIPVGESYEIDDAGNYHWAVEEADIHEVSVCTFPAYEQTEIEARQKNHKEYISREISEKKNSLKKD